MVEVEEISTAQASPTAPPMGAQVRSWNMCSTPEDRQKIAPDGARLRLSGGGTAKAWGVVICSRAGELLRLRGVELTA